MCFHKNSSFQHQTLGFCMFPHWKHVWFIGCAFYTPCLTCAFLMLCSCIAHSYLLYTHLLPLSCLSLYLVPSSLACHVYFMFCSILFLRCLPFIWALFFHSSCTPHAFLPLFISFFFPSFLFIHLSICDKKGESILESISESIVISLWLLCIFSVEKFYFVHICRRRNS